MRNYTREQETCMAEATKAVRTVLKEQANNRRSMNLDKAFQFLCP